LTVAVLISAGFAIGFLAGVTGDCGSFVAVALAAIADVSECTPVGLVLRSGRLGTLVVLSATGSEDVSTTLSAKPSLPLLAVEVEMTLSISPLVGIFLSSVVVDFAKRVAVAWSVGETIFVVSIDFDLSPGFLLVGMEI
jgi:hypothetical protein